MSQTPKEVNYMPGKDGTGPLGSGGGRLGRQSGRRSGRGKLQGSAGAGPGGFCQCPNCGTKTPHQVGQPCYEVKCPQCGTAMIRA